MRAMERRGGRGEKGREEQWEGKGEERGGQWRGIVAQC